MKKIIIALVMFVGISSVNAQSFGKGTSVIEAGVGFGGNYGMPIALGYEYGIAEKIGIGLTFGYASKSESSAFGEQKNTYMIFGGKGNYHFYNTEEMDIYGGVMLGFANVTSKFTYANPAFAGFPAPSAAASGMVYGFQVGARYYFTESFGAFAEVGYGVANVNAGVAYKF